MANMKIYSAVFIGGALGACLRYGLNLWIHTGQFPAATWLENAAGSLLLGILTGFFMIGAKTASAVGFFRHRLLRRLHNNVHVF